MADANPQTLAADVAQHPEEMKATFDITVGKYVSIRSTARITPAGVVTTGITISLVALALGYLAHGLRRW